MLYKLIYKAVWCSILNKSCSKLQRFGKKEFDVQEFLNFLFFLERDSINNEHGIIHLYFRQDISQNHFFLLIKLV